MWDALGGFEIGSRGPVVIPTPQLTSARWVSSLLEPQCSVRDMHWSVVDWSEVHMRCFYPRQTSEKPGRAGVTKFIWAGRRSRQVEAGRPRCLGRPLAWYYTSSIHRRCLADDDG